MRNAAESRQEPTRILSQDAAITRQITARLPMDLYNHLASVAEDSGRDLTGALIRILLEHRDGLEPPATRMHFSDVLARLDRLEKSLSSVADVLDVTRDQVNITRDEQADDRNVIVHAIDNLTEALLSGQGSAGEDSDQPGSGDQFPEDPPKPDGGLRVTPMPRPPTR